MVIRSDHRNLWSESSGMAKFASSTERRALLPLSMPRGMQDSILCTQLLGSISTNSLGCQTRLRGAGLEIAGKLIDSGVWWLSTLLRPLVPRAEIDGDIGDGHVGLQARDDEPSYAQAQTSHQ